MQVQFVNLPNNNNFQYSIRRLNFHTHYSLNLAKYYAPNNSKRGTVRAFFKGTTRDFAVTNRTKTFPLLERDFK